MVFKPRFSIVFKATWENTLFLSKQYFVQVYRQVGEHRIFSMLRLRLEDMGSVKMQTICRVCIESTQFFSQQRKKNLRTIYIRNSPPQRPHRKSGQRCGPAAININRKNCEDLERQTKHEFYFVVGRIHETFTFFCS